MTPKPFAVFLDVECEGAYDFIMDPQWPVIEIALRALNGVTNSLIVVEGPGPMHMNIGGGSAGRYVVSLTFDGQNHYVLQNPTAGPALVEFIVAGTTSLYPVAMLVSLDMALVAAKVFAETGLAAPTLPWLGTADIAQPNAESLKHPANS